MTEGTDANFQDLISKGLVLVDFYTPFCGPCRQLAPTLEKLESVSVVKVDVSSFPNIGSQYNITAVPTIIFFKEGQQVYRTMGVQSKELLQVKIDELLSDS